MSWKVRSGEESGVPNGDFTPDYGPNQEHFTIKCHYSGRFKTEPTLSYLDGKVDYIDYCSADEISKIEVVNMIAALGVEGNYNIYYSCTGVDECEVLEPVLIDKHALDLGLFGAAASRIVGIFVDHEMLPIRVITFPSVDENLGFYGDNADGNENLANEQQYYKDEEVKDSSGKGKEKVEECSKAWEGKGEGLSDIIDYDSEDSDGAVSLGDDSEHSDYMGDSDACYDIDNREFEQYVDHDEEWAGLKQPNASKPSNLEEIPDNIGEDQGPSHMLHHRDENRPIDLELGMCFTDAEDFRRTVRLHAINLGRDLIFPINNKFKVQAKCKNVKCEWLVYASRVKADDTFRIKTIHDKHKCPRLEKVVHANSKFLADKYMRKLRSDPRWPVDSMLEILEEENKLSFSKWQIYRCKKKVARVGAGDVVDQYKFLWSYAEEILKSNPGSTVRVKCKQISGVQSIFKRFYVCWDALKRGLLDGCRRVLCFDGCHLKTLQGGVLLSAVGIDANNGIYPFAYAIVEKEKKKSWGWFIDLIIRDLGIENSSLWTVMSDKQKGLVDAVNHLLPHCEHRFCVMHLYSNFKMSHRGLALKDILWKAARATRVVDFNRAMQSMKGRNVQAFEWLQKRDPKQWSRSHFSTLNKSDLMYNNLSESFNSILLKPRVKPIIKMLEEIRLILMLRIGVKRGEMMKHSGEFCPNIEEMLDVNKERSHSFKAIWNGHNEFNVEYSSTVAYKVHLGDHNCSCRRWQLTGIPCSHAICSMYYMGYTPEHYVADCYKKDTYLRAYSHFLHPLSSQDEWPTVEAHDRFEILPPKPAAMPGRPKKHKRRLQPDEKGSQAASQKKSSQKGGKNPKKFGSLGRKGLIITCKTCGVGGHNSRTCGKKKGNGLDIPASNPEKPSTSRKRKATCVRSTQSGSQPSAQRMRDNKGKGKEKVVEDTEDNSSQVTKKDKLQVRGKGKKLNAASTSNSNPKGASPSNSKPKGASPLKSKPKGFNPLFRARPLKSMLFRGSPLKQLTKSRASMSQPQPTTIGTEDSSHLIHARSASQPAGLANYLFLDHMKKSGLPLMSHVPPEEEPPVCKQQ